MTDILRVRDDDHIIYLNKEYISYRRVDELLHIVRCEECAFYNERGFCDKHSHIAKRKDDFCSWGERREDVSKTD